MGSSSPERSVPLLPSTTCVRRPGRPVGGTGQLPEDAALLDGLTVHPRPSLRVTGTQRQTKQDQPQFHGTSFPKRFCMRSTPVRGRKTYRSREVRRIVEGPDTETMCFRGSQEGCQGPSRPSGRNRGLPLRRRRGVCVCMCMRTCVCACMCVCVCGQAKQKTEAVSWQVTQHPASSP